MTESGNRLRRAARRLGSHQTSRVLLSAVEKGLGSSLILLAALLLLDRFLGLPALVRFVGLGLTVALPFAFVGGALFRRLPALRDLEEAARRTESQTEELKERLVPALQVLRIRDERRTGYSHELVDAFVGETAERVERVNPAALPYNRGLRRGLGVAAAGLVLAASVLAILGPRGTGDGLLRLALAGRELGPSAPAEFFVTPGDVSIPRGEDVLLSALVENAAFRQGRTEARLSWRTDEGSPWTHVELSGSEADATLRPPADAPDAPDAEPPGPLARFEHRFRDVDESFRYRFAHGSDVSREYEVKAVAHPTLTIEEVRYRYPEYTGLAERSVRDGSGDLAAVKGTTARLAVRSTNEPKVASLELESGGTIPLVVGEDGLLGGELVILDEDSYRLHIEDTLGLENQNPLQYRVRALTDEAPFIRLLEPGEDRDLDETMRVTLRFSAVDDYGLGPVKLVWEVSRREGEPRTTVIHRPSGRRTEINERSEWSLEDLDLLPGDTVAYHLEVRDNNAVDEPSTARTREYFLRFPTLGEIFAEIDDREEASIENLEEIVDEARRVEEKIEEISREVLKRGESSWENRKEVERALEAQEKLADRLKELQEEITSNLEQLTESEFASFEAMQKMEQIQKLLDEVATEEMKEALEKLRKAMEEVNARRMQEDLAEFQMSQEELTKNLDRILENLKQFRLEEKMKAAVRELEELAARQERVNDELDRAAEEKRDPTEADQEGDRAEEAEDADEADGENAEGQDAESEQKQEGEERADASESEKSDSEKKDGESSDPDSDSDRKEMERLAQEEKRLAEDTREFEKKLEEIAEMVRELRDAADQKSMDQLAEDTQSQQIPETMEEMAEKMDGGDKPGAQEQGEKALTQLDQLRMSLSQQQSMMQQRMSMINQAAINRAVRDLLSLSADEEILALDLNEIPRNSASATRSFADEQYLLIQGAERVEKMLTEVAKDTPLMDSQVGRKLGDGIEKMKDAAYGLENGAVHLAQDDGEQALEDLNAVVIALLEAAKTMSSCSSGMPMSGMMQQLQDLAGDQEKLNQMMKQMLEQNGKSLDERLQGTMRSLAQEQQRIRDELQKLLEELGDGQGFLGRLDDVSQTLDEVAKKLAEGDFDEGALREQEWALTRLLDAQRSIRERDFGKERRSRTGEDLADILPPSELPPGLEEEKRDLREDLLRALDRRYPPKYEELIRRYFRSLSDDLPVPDLP